MAAFLQNHADIILDAVLTDYGRKLLAKGDGSFNIVKFAFGDDEIDYGLFKPNETTLLQDEEILKTPILEAFTNNAASMKSQLLTLSLENILYMPILKLANLGSNATGKFGPTTSNIKFEGYVIPADISEKQNDTFKGLCKEVTGLNPLEGVLNSMDSSKRIYIHQGLDSSELDNTKSLKTENPILYETEYSVYLDYRFCYLADLNDPNMTALPPVSVDDDNIAVYKFSEQVDFNSNSAVQPMTTSTVTNIQGTKGSMLQLKVVPNSNLKNTTSYFDKYGKTYNLNPSQNSINFSAIRMPLRVMGGTTGYSVEIPILFAKKV